MWQRLHVQRWAHFTTIISPLRVSRGTQDKAPESARTPHSLGPALHYGHTQGHFLDISCIPQKFDGEGARISGFRLFGPDFGQQKDGQLGITIDGCVDVEVWNMEIAGWGNTAIEVGNSNLRNVSDPAEPNPVRVLIHDNFLHNNQHPSEGGHAAGYGASTAVAAWARIYQNVFDNNRHAISAGSDSGGYRAEHNLVLKGGGYHGKFGEKYMHSFDVHGSANCPDTRFTRTLWNCGDAGYHFLISENAFQYKKEIDVRLRGKPREPTVISGNVFARSDEDAAIKLYTHDNVSVVNNVYNIDTYGDYGVCDFDGDGVDDLFLATGVSWWFSSFGEFHWSHLNNQRIRLQDLRLGYFDADQRCDVLREGSPGQWSISSGGTTDWILLGNFQHPLSEVQFGRFDANMRDHRPNVTRQTTHAFWRRADGQWFVTPLSHPDWKPVQSSSIPMNQLRFGDFTGDGVTDVLAVEGGHWSISESATGQWQPLNPNLHDPVGQLYIANMDADDNIDDLLRLDAKMESVPGSTVQVYLTWWRSKNGREPWKVWKSYNFSYPQVSPGNVDAEYVPVFFGFAGRFGAAPGGGTMVTDSTRIGHFHSEAEASVGASPDWTSLFPY